MPFSLPLPIVRALILWLLILAAESVLGALRRVLVGDLDFIARQAAEVISVAMIFTVTWAARRWINLRSSREALSVGLGWAVLTLGFEFAIGGLTGAGWERIRSDYDLAHGGLMPIGLVMMALTPWLVMRLQSAGNRPQA